MLFLLCIVLFLGAAFSVAWLVNRQAWTAGEVAAQVDLDRVCA